MANKKLPIIFNIEDGIGVRKERRDYEKSTFYEQYKVAFRILRSICKNAETGDNGKAASNIVAICGDRGEGKTSLLTSIKTILSDSDAYKAAKTADIVVTEDAETLSPEKVKVLDIIDPAFFDDKHHLIELVLGQMYNAVKDDTRQYYEQHRLAEKQSQRDDLMQKFQKVRQSMLVVNGAPEDAYDKLDEIDDLSTGMSLRRNLNELFEAYCNYFGRKRIVIMIDDLDLNATDGYKMVEEIRKYLSNPQYCLLVIAMKVEQLHDVVMSYQREKFKDQDLVSNNVIKDMAEKFVIKLLPESQRVVMPGGTGLVERELQIFEGEKFKERFVSAKEAVVWLIFRKTRYVFVNGRNLSPIVPTNLRELRTLVHLLWALPDITRDEAPANFTNKEQFKTYFYYTWTNILRNEDRTFVRELVENEDLTSLNKGVVQHLNDVYEKYYNNKEENKLQNKSLDLFAQIVDKRNRIQNISVGDVMYVVRYMESIVTDKKDLDLLFFIKAFYSIKMYEAYDVISFDEDHLFVNNEQDESSKYFYKYDQQLKKMNQLQRLLNGSYFTYEQGDLLPAKRDMRAIKGYKLRELMRELPEKAEDCKGYIIYQLQICEYFILTSTRPLYADKKLHYDRMLSSRGYFEPFTKDNNWLVFDALSIFYNVINIKQTYERWNNVCKINDFYNYAKSVNGSLLNNLIGINPDYDVPQGNLLANPPHAFISDATIRISDVILSILDNAENNRNIAKTGGNLYNLRMLYNGIRNIGIRLYPLNDQEDDSGELRFLFLQPIDELFKTLTTKSDLIDEAKRKELLELFDEVFGIEEEEDIHAERKRRISERESLKPQIKKLMTSLLQKIKYPTVSIDVIDAINTHDPLLMQLVGVDFWKDLLGVKVQYSSFDDIVKRVNSNTIELQKRLLGVYYNPNETETTESKTERNEHKG